MTNVQESQRIPVPDDTEEVAIRTVDGKPALVLVDHQGRRCIVPVTMAEAPRVSAVAA